MNLVKFYRPYILDKKIIPSHVSLKLPISLQIALRLKFSDNFEKSHELVVCIFLVVIVGEALLLTLCYGRY